MKRSILIAILATSLSGCYNDKYDKLYPASPATTCDTANVSYKTDIHPIINASCAISGGCHDAAGNATTGNLDYTQFSILQSQATADLIIADIKGTPTKGHNTMPLNLPQISQCNIDKITAWVNQGAQNN